MARPSFFVVGIALILGSSTALIPIASANADNGLPVRLQNTIRNEADSALFVENKAAKKAVPSKIEQLAERVNTAPVKQRQYRILEPINPHPVALSLFNESHDHLIRLAEHRTNPKAKSNEPIATTTSEIETDADADWFGTVMSFPQAKSQNQPINSQIVVHPPTSSGPNLFSFVIENTQQGMAPPFMVEFKTPNDVSVLQVFPFQAKTTSHLVQLEISELAGHSQSTVHIMTTPAAQGAFSFETCIRMQQTQAFQVKTNGALKSNSSPHLLPLSPQKSAVATNAGWSPDRLNTTKAAPSIDTDITIDPLPAESTKQPAPANSTRNQSLAKPSKASTTDLRLETSLSAPLHIVQAQEYEYEIIVKNTSPQPATEIIVQLTMPTGMMITNLDRAAWVNEAERTVSWKLASLEAGQAGTIPYRATVMAGTEVIQKVVVGMNGTYQGTVESKSKVESQTGQSRTAHR